MIRYLSGLLGAYLLLGLMCALAVVPTMLLTGRGDRASAFVSMWVMFGVPTVGILATVVGPVILGLRRVLNTRVLIGVSALVGAAVGPSVILLLWFVFRESDETFAGLLQFWTRVPGEFVVGVLPPSTAGIFFCVWLAHKKQRIRLSAA